MLIHHDTRLPRPTAFRVPAHLAGADLVRREADDGDLVAIGNPLLLAPPPADADWLDLGDDWRVALVGDFDPSAHLRREHDLPPLIPIADSAGRAWHAPVVLSPNLDNPEGNVVLSLPWGKDATGGWARVPTAAQAAVISAARAARAEILKDQLGKVPVPIAAEWFLTIAASIYHLTPAMFAKWGWIDDRLVQNFLLGANGFRKPVEN